MVLHLENEYTGASSSAGDTGGNNSEIENTEYQSFDMAGARNDALIRALELQGKSSDSGNRRDRKAKKERRQMQGKSWIEMVKQNVNKYQAALARSTGNKSSESAVPEIISSIAKSSKSLVALLQQPASVLPTMTGTYEVPVCLLKIKLVYQAEVYLHHLSSKLK
jgi:hypothetical protein